MTRSNINTAVALAAVLVAANLIGGIVAEMANIATAIFATLFVAAKFSSRVARVLSMNVGGVGAVSGHTAQPFNHDEVGYKTNAATGMFIAPGSFMDAYGNPNGIDFNDE